MNMQHFYIERCGPYAVAVLDTVQLYPDRPTDYTITRVNVPDRFQGLGHGSALLRRVCADADKDGVTLHLQCASSGSLSNEQLTAWYARNGFVGIGGADLMVRTPRGPSASTDMAENLRCESCNWAGHYHCSDPVNCGGPWSTPVTGRIKSDEPHTSNTPKKGETDGYHREALP